MAAAAMRLVLPVAVRVVVVRRLARHAHADQRADVREAVGEGVEAVGDDADGAGDVAKHQLGHRDDEVQEENADEDGRDRLIALSHARRAAVRRCAPWAPATTAPAPCR